MMRHYLTNQHRARVTAPGWEAQILDWDKNGAAFRFRGRTCLLIRRGHGFIPYASSKPLCDNPQIPDTALAYIWRAVHNPNHTEL
jgi:hypothetical protein